MTPPSIPMKRRLPVVGHMHLFRPGRFVQGLMAIGQDFDGLFRIDLGNSPGLIVTNVALATELADATRFRKVLHKALLEVRPIVGDGLFSAKTEEPNWAIAHRVLMPAFGQRAMRGYFPMMLEVADQLVAKWASQPGVDIHVADDMTRLTMDTISLAGFGRKFDSFARADQHPFLTAMSGALRETMDRLTRPPLPPPPLPPRPVSPPRSRLCRRYRHHEQTSG